MKSLRVLVADDDHDLLSTIADGLEQSGTTVTRASSGGELLEALAESDPFDLVITDVSMPWMTGLHVAHSARSAGLPTPVIVITALKDESIDESVHALGERAWLLRKPFDFPELEAAISRATAGCPTAASASAP